MLSSGKTQRCAVRQNNKILRFGCTVSTASTSTLAQRHERGAGKEGRRAPIGVVSGISHEVEVRCGNGLASTTIGTAGIRYDRPHDVNAGSLPTMTSVGRNHLGLPQVVVAIHTAMAAIAAVSARRMRGPSEIATAWG